jgi:hypothetical protein
VLAQRDRRLIQPAICVVTSCGRSRWWLDRPGVPRGVVIAAMLRVTRRIVAGGR